MLLFKNIPMGYISGPRGEQTPSPNKYVDFTVKGFAIGGGDNNDFWPHN